MSILAVTDKGDGNTVVEVICDFHSPAISEELKVPTLGFYNWFVRGVHIQKAMPGLTPEQREKLMTGMCDSCNRKIFGDMEE